MPQKLIQRQTQTQTQTLSPMQVAFVRMLELPVTDLEERVRNEMLENSALEENDDDRRAEEETEQRETDDEGDGYEDDVPTHVNDALGDYLNDDETPDYLKTQADEARERHEIPLTEDASFYESLNRQVNECDLTPEERTLLEYLIGSLDADGFLRKDLETLADELAVYHNIDTDKKELERLLGVLQTFEPRGIGARNLQECLRLQLTDPDNRSPHRRQALDVVDRCFDDFIHKRKENIKRRMGWDEETYGHVMHELTHLNPRPGSALNEGESHAAPTVVPDFFLTVADDGSLTIRLNHGEVPELRVSRAFRDSIREYADKKNKLSREQKDTYLYACRKVEAAQSFIDILHRRNNTLYAVMRTIAELQRPFFDEDDESRLRPMTLKDVAERTRLDISTVSRVTNSKYVQTAYGTYPLKFFFSSQFKTNEGEELSSRKIKALLRRLIEEEDKNAPLPDEALAARLKEQGYPVARRTVAKYREQMGFPPARLRR